MHFNGVTVAKIAFEALTPKVRQCREQFTAGVIGSALYGLRNLRDSVAARGLVAALTPKVKSCSDTFPSHFLVFPLTL